MKKRARSKATKTASVLSRQKPRRAPGKRRFSGSTRRVLVAAATLAAATLTIGITYWFYIQYPAPAEAAGAGQDWQVNLRVVRGEPLEPAAAAKAIETARRLLGAGSLAEISAAARAVQRQGAYASANIIRLAPSSVALSLERRQPLMFIEADRLRFLGDNGAVYGEAAVGGSDQKDFPVLRGVFDERSGRFRLGEDRSLQVSDPEAAAILEAIALTNLARKAGFSISSLSFDKYRGFTVQMSGDGPEIIFGREPFDHKFSKLQKILAHLAKNGSQASRIELDYQGKAFVKKRKL